MTTNTCTSCGQPTRNAVGCADCFPAPTYRPRTRHAIGAKRAARPTAGSRKTNAQANRQEKSATDPQRENARAIRGSYAYGHKWRTNAPTAR